MCYQNDMKDGSLDHRSSRQDEIAEELALREALKRTRLEEAARNPGLSLSKWVIYIIVGIFLLNLGADLIYNVLILFIFVIFHIEGNSRAIHSRIDALLELDRLKVETIKLGKNKGRSESGEAEPSKLPE